MRYGPSMSDEDGFFGEPVAAGYDESSADMFAPGVVDPAAAVLAELAGDTATQAMSSNYIEVSGGRGEYTSIPFRYVWPAELDLMAQLAGLRLRERWDGWTRAPFTSESRQHVSIWAKDPGPG